MEITVRLFATLREQRANQMVVEINEGASVEEVVQLLKIPAEDVAIIMINGRGKNLDTKMENGDVLALFPPVGGG